MGKYIIIIALWVSFFCSYAQQPVSPPQPAAEASLTLDQRFVLMKTRGQSYNDYKVIKELVLDGVWKITKDSITRMKTELSEAKARISRLENEAQQSADHLKQKDSSVEEIIFDSTHVTVLGLPFNKSFFLVLVALVLGGLGFLLVVLFGSLRFTRSHLKEKEVAVDVLTKEFDEYKRKALDKETKILRQLQDERNKYHASIR